MSAYLVDNCTRPIQVCRPGSRDPSFYVQTVAEAFQVIDLDIAMSEEITTKAGDGAGEQCNE